MDVSDFRPDIAAIQLALQGNLSIFVKETSIYIVKSFHARTRLHFRRFEEGIFLKTAMETLSFTFTVHVTYNKE